MIELKYIGGYWGVYKDKKIVRCYRDVEYQKAVNHYEELKNEASN